MRFIKFWWRHSLRDGLLVTLFIVAPIWVSGFIHWYIYPRGGGEDHVKTAILTCLAWIGIGLLMYVGVSILKFFLDYFTSLIREYKDAQP